MMDRVEVSDYLDGSQEHTGTDKHKPFHTCPLRSASASHHILLVVTVRMPCRLLTCKALASILYLHVVESMGNSKNKILDGESVPRSTLPLYLGWLRYSTPRYIG